LRMGFLPEWDYEGRLEQEAGVWEIPRC